ncbi:thioredoxin 1, partial [Phenoliferia sp. Uapishka_3]
MSMKVINSMAELNAATSSPHQISIIDFHATWCGPCKMVAPTFQKLATEYLGRVSFFKVDVDKAQDVAQHFKVTAMPTFVVLKGRNKLEEMKGAAPAGLEALVRKHAPAGVASGSGSGAAPEKGLEGTSPLNSLIDMAQISCLNENASHNVRDLLKGGGDKWLESDADEQLLIHIPMNSSTKIRALRLVTLPSAAAHAPKTIKLFVNRANLGFDDAESEEPAQEIEITAAQASGSEAIQLRFVRFVNVSVLSIFVVDNQGGEDVTRIDKLELLGLAIESTDMSQLAKGEDDHEH